MFIKYPESKAMVGADECQKTFDPPVTVTISPDPEHEATYSNIVKVTRDTDAWWFEDNRGNTYVIPNQFDLLTLSKPASEEG